MGQKAHHAINKPDACFGDSGGPFVMRDPESGAWEQVETVIT